jgi:general secretion pathway protein B
MSFILDALKKSESDRQRQSGPALYEVRVAPPRAGLPLWAVAIAALLAINLGIVLWMLLRSNAREAAAVNAAAAPAPAAVAPASTPAAAPAPTAAPPAATPTPPPVAAAASSPPPAAERTPAPLTAPPAAEPSALSPPPAVARATPTPPPAAGNADETQNPQDYAPAQESSAGNTPRVRRASAAGVPLYQDAAATPGTQIPQLHLDFHMYAPAAPDRFVMINMHKLHEGDSTPDGVHVNSITPDGAVLSYNGQTFMLPRE